MVSLNTSGTSAGSGNYSGSVAGSINYGHSNARDGYSRGLSGRVSYSLAMPKSYGTDVNLDSYLMRGRKGIAGYVDNLIKYSLASLKTGYSYLGQKKQELYKIQEMMKNYELKMIKGGGGKLGAMIPDVPMYDLSSMRKPVINLEERLKKYKRKCPTCGSDVGLTGGYSMN